MPPSALAVPETQEGYLGAGEQQIENESPTQSQLWKEYGVRKDQLALVKALGWQCCQVLGISRVLCLDCTLCLSILFQRGHSAVDENAEAGLHPSFAIFKLLSGK